MATIMGLINCHDHSSKEFDELLQDLICSNGDIPFHIEQINGTENAIVSVINNYLNQARTRYNGLVILDKILSHCSKDIVSKYCILWISKATQVLESIHSVPQELNISCKVLGQLIIRTKGISEIQKQISTQNVKQLISVVGNLNTEKKCGSVYYLIAVLLHQYPEVCERFQAIIKKLVLLQVDSTQKNLVDASARCYALLAKATERTFKPPLSNPTYTGWLYHEAVICNNLHIIMNVLFSDLVELENVSILDKLELPHISAESIFESYFKRKRRFLNLCSYLAYMLREFDKKNSVLTQEILKVICRGLAVQPSNVKNLESFKNQFLYVIIPQLHVALFNVLDALIYGFKEQLIPFGSTILQLFLQTLQWTEEVTESQITFSGNKPFRNVRISVYKCLTSWLANTHSLSGVETIADEYLPSILKDIVPEKDRVLLTIQKTTNLSKRQLKRLRNNQYEEGVYLTNGLTSSKEYYLDVDVCKGSLMAVENIFSNGGTLLKQTFVKTIQNIIIPLLYDCYLSSTEHKFYKENSDCRLHLLRLLRTLQMNPHCSVPLPTQYSLEIFEMALCDNNLCIMQEAKVALAELEKIVHPHAPSIQLTQVETIQKEFVADNQSTEHTETVDDVCSLDAENIIVEDTMSSSNTKNKAINFHPEENIIDEDTAPSSSKRMKVTDDLDKSVEPTANISDLITKENIAVELQVEQTYQNLLRVSSNPSEKEILLRARENSMETVGPKQITDKSLNEAEVVLVAKHSSESVDIETQSTLLVNPAKENEEIIDTSKDVYQNLRNDSNTTEADPKYSSAENENEEEEILQLFQDVPKDND
ncbi:PREDICTED: proline-, glutamic acid- and leucine-rich protein 1-like [Dufourea novaeangliae]|uniref:proline-, glutamic acid- and leucine-rich protein 1-like n=1 Tax=Dufourea novaeangliae TaxID=178035 RepID=UPI000767761F|nr:PREDICTED: proline-, glutamic acid- and leucine-rich protein 1-like [Dufourea novaeangliae]